MSKLKQFVGKDESESLFEPWFESKSHLGANEKPLKYNKVIPGLKMSSNCLCGVLSFAYE